MNAPEFLPLNKTSCAPAPWARGGLAARLQALPPERARIAFLAFGLFVLAVLVTVWSPAFLADLATFLVSHHSSIVSSRTPAVFATPLFWGMAALILASEALYPADAEQQVLSRGLATDTVYFLTTMLFRATVISAYVGLLKSLYDAHLHFLTIGLVADLPTAARLAVSILVIDCLGWCHHYIRHRVPVIWRLHAIHHSQEQLNLFSPFRIHPLDYVVSVSLVSLPMFVTGSSTSEAFAFSFFSVLHAMLTHANVRWRLGPLRYILVTPQSHRIHHSTLPEHYGRNLGVIFSIWDRLFGTAYDGDEYPAVGVRDPAFPRDRDKSRGLLRTVALQWAYPLQCPVTAPGSRA
jgi:sterol desaturase/sphingolipid hydroxylase (fatty acid hydroxylase superfamily)